jgi:hypothetical protein
MERAKKEVELLLKSLNGNYLWKYEIKPLIGDEKYFRKEKKYYLGNNYMPSHTFGFVFNFFNRKIKKLLKENYIVRLKSDHSLEFLIRNLEDLERFYKNDNFFFQM